MAKLLTLVSMALLAATAATSIETSDQNDTPSIYSELSVNKDLQKIVQKDLAAEERLKNDSKVQQEAKAQHELEDKEFHEMAAKVSRFHSITVVGDSYSSGDGALANAGKGLCRKNEGSFGWRLNKLLKPDAFNFLPCSGAPVKDILNKQVNSEYYVKPDLVLMTAGGDNGGSFFHVLMGCILRPSEEKCDTAIDLAYKIADEMPNSLEPLYKAMTSKQSTSRRREIIHLGYVQMYNRDNPKVQCPAFTWYQGSDVTWPSAGEGGYRDKINKVIAKINSKIKETAEKNGITYIDVDGLFDGHRFCDGPNASWMQHRLSLLHEDGVICHPTFEGHGAYINATLQYLLTQNA